MTYLSVVFDLLINLVQGFKIRAGKGCDATSGPLHCFGGEKISLVRYSAKGPKWELLIFDHFSVAPHFLIMSNPHFCNFCKHHGVTTRVCHRTGRIAHGKTVFAFCVRGLCTEIFIGEIWANHCNLNSNNFGSQFCVNVNCHKRQCNCCCKFDEKYRCYFRCCCQSW